MPLKWKSKIILFKIESAYGTDALPTGAANGVLATNVSLTPMDGSDVSRDLELSFMGGQGTIPAELHAKINFRVELAGSGAAGTAPAWGPLLRCCAVAETVSPGVSVTYNPISDNHESGTFYFWIESTLYSIVGTRGNAKLMVDAQGIPYIDFEMQGLFVQPSETARDTPDLAAFQKPRLGTSTNTPTFTIGGTSLVLRSFAMDLGNAVENRFLIGSENVLITDKSEAIEMKVEAVPLTTLNPYTLAANQSTAAVNLVHGTAAGNIATLNAPLAQMQRPAGLENAQNITEWPLRMAPLPSGAGNDQWTLVLT